MPTSIRILSLGEIVTPNLAQGLQALATVIASKKSSSSQLTADMKNIMGMVQSAIVKNQNVIEQFKIGAIDEDGFNNLFIAALAKETEVKLTTAEFDAAWSKMNPPFSVFKSFLEDAASYNNHEDQKIILISYTNPKDIRQLMNELKANNQQYTIDNAGNLTSINNMPLHITYVSGKNKADLIKDIILQLKNNTAGPSFFTPAKASSSSDKREPDMKYIYGVNNIKFQALKEDFDKTTESIEATASAFSVDTVLWNKDIHKSLADFLNDKKVICGSVLAAKL